MRSSRQSRLPQAGGGTIYGWRIGQNLYTASDIKLPPDEVYPPNHQFAGWLYGGVFRIREASDGRSLGIGIDIGCLGPCAGGLPTQNGFHRLLRQPLAQGWSRQVRNEPGVILHAELVRSAWAEDVCRPLQTRPARRQLYRGRRATPMLDCRSTG